MSARQLPPRSASPAWALRAGVATAATAASASAASWVAYNFLLDQAKQARIIIPKLHDAPPNADGIYTPGEPGYERYTRKSTFDLHLMIFGDSTATGYGCATAEETPGVLLAHGLADETGRVVRLSTKAIVGATSKGLSGQVDAMFIAGPPPDAAVIMIGANDVTAKNGITASARRLGSAVARLRKSGAVVIVGTCPDLGVVTAVPQPLRQVLRTWGMRLAKAQCGTTRAAGGVPVPIADLLAPEFLQQPDRLFASDRYHPSAVGYQLAAGLLLPPLCQALGEWTGGAIAEPPETSAVAESLTIGAKVRSLLRKV